MRSPGRHPKKILAITAVLLVLLGCIAARQRELRNEQASSTSRDKSASDKSAWDKKASDKPVRKPNADKHDWDKQAAAKYLDERMELWFSSAKKLRTSESQTTCVSCHTTIPYVLARPALRRALHVVEPAAQEQRLLDETIRRVQSYDAHQLLYDHTASKKTESRGTEAVLNALILASSDAAQKYISAAGPGMSSNVRAKDFVAVSFPSSLDRQERSAIIQLAFKRLWETQRADGAWDWLDFGLEPFETVDGTYYGATLAALAAGIRIEASKVAASKKDSAEATTGRERLRAYLKEKYVSQSMFNRIWLLLASTRLNDLLSSAQRASLITEIQGRQRDDGGWSLDSLGTWKWSKSTAPFRAPGTTDSPLLSQSDGYATGLIVYALRQAGLKSDQPAVNKGLQWLRTNQQDVQVDQHNWHAWRAYSLNFDREHGGDKGEPWRRMFMSDSATAFAVLALISSE